ncbi:MAG: hypothetical protein JNK37_04435 [Verrucomicrobiales bacterium]|nr:hypothetical protein [Verrucomicrobiales bacterium]
MNIPTSLAFFAIALSGCSKTEDRFWGYEVDLPPEFMPSGTDVADLWQWKTKDGNLEVGHLRYSSERSAFSSLEEVAEWIGAGGEQPRPTFRRAPNGLDVAVDMSETWTQIAIAIPENTKYWEIFLYGISPGDPSDRESRLLRERAIAAILSGRPTRK